MENDLAGRLIALVQAIIAQQGLRSERAFLQQAGWGPTVLYKIKTKQLQVAPSHIAYLVNQYGASSHYLLTGQGPMFAQAQQPEASTPQQPDNQAIVLQVPLLPIAVSATFNHLLDGPAPSTERQTVALLKPEKDLAPGSLVVQISGDSMEPQLRHGAQVLCEPCPRDSWPMLHQGVYCVFFQGSAVVKRIKDNQLATQGALTLHSDNERAGSLQVPAQQLQAIYRAVQVLSMRVY